MRFRGPQEQEIQWSWAVQRKDTQQPSDRKSTSFIFLALSDTVIPRDVTCSCTIMAEPETEGSFFADVLKPGSSFHPTFLAIVDGVLAVLLVVLISLAFLTSGNIHFIFLIVIELCLWASVKWLASLCSLGIVLVLTRLKVYSRMECRPTRNYNTRRETKAGMINSEYASVIFDLFLPIRTISLFFLRSLVLVETLDTMLTRLLVIR